MTRTGRTFDQYLAEYVSTAPAEELELFEQHSEYYQLASELLEMRTSRGLTQEECAELAGLQQSEVSRMERGEGNPTLKTLTKLTRALGARVAVIERNHAHR